MNFIDILQQGGFILPQYNPGQQTIQPPNSAMQALNTMLQSDQQTFAQDMQRQLLALSRDQANFQKNISIANYRLQKSNQDRLNKMYDLHNRKQEFAEQKEILDNIEESRKKREESFLPSDLKIIEEQLQKAGLDDNGIIEAMKMKGGMNFDTYSKHKLNQIGMVHSYKTGFSNMKLYTDAQKIIDKASKQLEKADNFMELGILNRDNYLKITDALKEATKKAINFYNDPTQGLDLQDDHFATVTGYLDLIDSEEFKKQVELKTEQKRLENEAARLEMDNSRIDMRIKEMLAPFTAFSKFGQALRDNVPLLEIMMGLPGGIEFDMNNPNKFFEDLKTLDPRVKENVYKYLTDKFAEKGISTGGSSNKYKNLSEFQTELLEKYMRGEISEEKLGKIVNVIRAMQGKEATSGSLTDSNGNTYIKTKDSRVYKELGFKTKKDDPTKLIEVNVKLDPLGNTAIGTVTYMDKIPVATFNIDGRTSTFKVEQDSSTGKYYLKVRDANSLQALTGKRGESWRLFGMNLGINEELDYDPNDDTNKPDSMIPGLRKYGDSWVIDLAPYSDEVDLQQELEDAGINLGYDPNNTFLNGSANIQE